MDVIKDKHKYLRYVLGHSLGEFLMYPPAAGTKCSHTMLTIEDRDHVLNIVRQALK